MVGQLRVGQVNAKIRVTIKENNAPLPIGAATVKKFLFKRPSGTVLSVDANFTTDGSDGQLEYVTVANDLTEVGSWQGQPYIEMNTAKFHGTPFGFQVGDVIS